MTSEQYKYLLVERLRRNISLVGAKNYQRIYYYNIFALVFNDSVTVTEESYQNFCALMDRYLEVCARDGLRTADEIYDSDSFEEGYAKLQTAFAAVGVTVVLDTSANEYPVTFTMPDGSTLTVSGTDLFGKGFAVNSKASVTYSLACKSIPYYRMDDLEIPDDINFHRAGPSCFWSYDGDSTMTITGTGRYDGAPTDAQLGAGSYTTVILGANVTELGKWCLVSDVTTFVLLRPADGTFTIDPDFNLVVGTCSDSNSEIAIYTDCETALAAEGLTNVTFYSLDDWEG